jgi:hypothetical protein
VLDILESQKGMVMTQDSHDEKRRKHMAVMDDKTRNKSMAEYRYIGKDGKPILARDLEDQRDELQVKLTKAVDVIKHLINIAPEGDNDEWHIALDDAAEALAKIKGDKK